MTSLYCHPWVGEFGWELCWWNPMVRYYAQQHDYTTVAAPENSRYLYEFANRFIPLQTKGITYWEGELQSEPPMVSADFHLIPEQEFKKHKNEPSRNSTKRLWRSLVPEKPIYQADIMCSFRPAKYIRERKIVGKEYPINKCQQIVDVLISEGFSVACFGGSENHCPDGAKDLRNKSLEVQCGAISMAKCVVGPSSGPIHLASLCKCPHVTWIASIHYALGKRYEKTWNPFDVPVHFICHSRRPSPGEIVQHVKALVDVKREKGI